MKEALAGPEVALKFFYKNKTKILNSDTEHKMQQTHEQARIFVSKLFFRVLYSTHHLIHLIWGEVLFR